MTGIAKNDKGDFRGFVQATAIIRQAKALGFDLVGIIPAGPVATYDRYRAWLDRGNHGGMGYLARPDAVDKRADPRRILPAARSVVVVGVNYYPAVLPEQTIAPSQGCIARYAWGNDYHDILLPRLHRLKDYVEEKTGRPPISRAYVDTGPLLERALAMEAGLGFIGKNTNLIHPRLGSWLFLGELLLDLELPATTVGGGGAGGCGSCTRCLDACPTGALTAPYSLDARRCISYLTIEHKGSIPRELRPLLGNHIFGCDICQEVCPWNQRFARPTNEAAFRPGTGHIAPYLLDLMNMDDEEFQRRFRRTALWRTKRRGLLRNVAIALGNWGDPVAVPVLRRALHDKELPIREHAAWALERITARVD